MVRAEKRKTIMSSFEFYGRERFASCQYHAEDFFVALDDVAGEFPLLGRARIAFEALHDDIFSHAKGETKALQKEMTQIIQELKGNLQSPAKRYGVFFQIAGELEAVFAESEAHKTDIQFRWG